MKETIYPLPLKQSTSEQLTDAKIKEYWNYIKLYFKFKLKYNPKVVDYNHIICIQYDDFWFRVTENYKIEIRLLHKHADDGLINKRLDEIKNVVKKYYPKIYDKKV